MQIVRFFDRAFAPLLCLLLSICVAVLPASGALALDITAIRFGAHPDKQRAVIELSAPTDFRAFVMGTPDRLVLDLDRFAWNNPPITRGKGVNINDVRYGDLGNGKGRLVFQTDKPVMVQSAFFLPKGSGQPDRLVVDFKPVEGSSTALPVATGQQMIGNMPNDTESNIQIASTRAFSVPLPPRKGTVQAPESNGGDYSSSGSASGSPSGPRRQDKPLIIIDAGHGGPDSGAIGANGMYEKTIVLAVAHELRRQLEDSGRYRVKMTRETDIFIPLRGRVNIARKHKGDLFISLHADSIRDSTVTGASVYTLSDKASDKETEKLAERENKADLIAGIDLSDQEDDVAGILINLAARDTMNQSKFLANTVVRKMDNNGIKTLESAHRSAGFAVLKAMDIPSILIEMGYLTNRSEVERLSSPQHRQKIAGTIKQAVDSYFQKVEK